MELLVYLLILRFIPKFVYASRDWCSGQCAGSSSDSYLSAFPLSTTMRCAMLAEIYISFYDFISYYDLINVCTHG